MNTRSREDLLNPVDEAALARAAGVLGPARHGYLAVLQPGSGWPGLSRVALGRDAEGVPLILISQLSAHFGALEADGRCCLLVGEPGSGDPLAYARLSMDCLAERVGDAERPALRERFVAWQPKAALYVNFADFAFWRLRPVRASFNAGFGKAFALDAEQIQAALLLASRKRDSAQEARDGLPPAD